jgi:hypothetical protein
LKRKLIKWSLIIGILYLIYLFWFAIIITLGSLIAFLAYSVYSIKSRIKNLKKEDLDDIETTAKRLFPYNKFARAMFKKAVNGVKEKEKEQEKEEVDKCLEMFGLTDTENIDESIIKKTWKKLAREYHPDRHTDENIKNDMHDKTAQINDCKEKLINFYKTK